MGAFADYDAYLDALRRNRGADFQMSAGGRAFRLQALWPNFVPAPVAPTTSVALNDTSDIAIGPLPTVNTGRLTLLGARANPGGAGGVCLIVADILNQSGGLNSTLTTTQTTNLPTAALTRMIALNDFQGAHVVDAVSSGGFVGSLAQAEPGACISLLGVMNAAQVVSGSILLAEV